MTEKILFYICIYLAVINIISIVAVAYDKSISRLKRGSVRRIPEKTFVRLSLLGGSIGTLLAMLMLRHKTKTKPILLFKIVMLFILWTAILFVILYLIRKPEISVL